MREVLGVLGVIREFLVVLGVKENILEVMEVLGVLGVCSTFVVFLTIKATKIHK